MKRRIRTVLLAVIAFTAIALPASAATPQARTSVNVMCIAIPVLDQSICL